MSEYDVIFLGSSPNALASAARLAGGGVSVLVLEPRDMVGGPVVTEEFAPGFRGESGVTSASLDPEIQGALGLSIDVIRRDTLTSLGAEPHTIRADRCLPGVMTQAIALLRSLNAIVPPPLPQPMGRDATTLHDLAAHLTGMGSRDMQEVLRILFMSARDLLGESGLPPFEQGIFGGLSVRGISEGPFSAGTVYHCLQQFAVGDGLSRCTVRGGLGKLSQALAEKARAAGATVRTGLQHSFTVEVEAGAAKGVRLHDGTLLSAGAVASDYDARRTFTRFVSPTHLDPEFNRSLRNTRYRGSVARVQLALRSRPTFNGLGEEAHRGTLVVAPDVAYLERAWDHAKRGGVSEHPYLEVTIPSLADPSLTPEGKHVVGVWVQYVPYGRGDRARLLGSVMQRLESLAPGISAGLLQHEVLLPEDLESRFGLTEGQIHGGEGTLQQAFFLRPFPGAARYETPIEDLYLTGSAAHPAGYSGRSGWNFAGAVLEGRFVRG